MRFLEKLASLFWPKTEEYNDTVFGMLRRIGSGDWQGTVPFHHGPTQATSFSLLIAANDGPPTEEQGRLFQEVLSRYAELWPRIGDALARYRAEHEQLDVIASHISDSCICLQPLIPGQPRRWSMQYTISYPSEGDMAYFVDLCEWDIEDVDAAD